MRCFIAIDIGNEIKTALSDLQSQISGQAKDAGVKKSDAKWVRVADVHLTLKFLGEVGDAKIVEICNIVRQVTGRHKNFELDVETVGFFGGKSARVLWVGTGEGKDKLIELQTDIEEQLAQVGWPKEKRLFSGHLTLCRIRNTRAGVKLAEISQEYKDFRLGINFVDSVTVYQSQLTPKGPIYTPLGNYKLPDGKFE